MSLYSERLAHLKKEISLIKAKKSKKFKKNQQIMINFINGVTSKAIFEIKGTKITLFLGDERKGFRHILEKHFCKGCEGEIEAMDILNLSDVFERGLQLANQGVSNSNLEVFMSLKDQKEHRLVLKKINDGSLVVTLYTKKMV